MNKKIVLWNLKKERLEKIISLREKEMWVLKLKLKINWKKAIKVLKEFIIDLTRLIVLIVNIFLNTIYLLLGYTILLGLKADKYLFFKK